MKNRTYDAVSTIAVVSVVVFTIASQYSSRAGYVFGALAILAAAGLFVAYIKALPDRASTSDHANQASGHQALEQAIHQASETVARREALERNVREDLYRKLLLTKRAARGYATLYDGVHHLRERQLMLFFDAVHHGTADLKAGSYYTQVKIHHEQVHDAASIIVKVVEKLCAASKEPRFEFILGPDGSFKIQQISAKRMAEPIAPQEEPVEESEKSQVIN